MSNTNTTLHADLEYLQNQLGLEPHQKDDLLREIADLAVWVVTQAARGKTIMAYGEDGVDELHHPLLDQMRPPARLLLNDEEATRLEAVLSNPQPQPPALRELLQRISRGDHTTPTLVWSTAKPQR